jgi:hypothetical protein
VLQHACKGRPGEPACNGFASASLPGPLDAISTRSAQKSRPLIAVVYAHGTMFTTASPHWPTWVAGFLLASVVGCDRGSGGDPPAPASAAPSKATSTPGVTIRQGKDGRATVDGAPLHGDPKVCAAFQKCCSSPDLSLMCGLTQASENGDCAKALAAVKQYAKESRSPGCKE